MTDLALICLPGMHALTKSYSWCDTHSFAAVGAQAYAADTANGFAGNSTAFASATARFSIVRECLYNATTASSAEASASATAASTAIAQSNATSASQAITGAICNPVTATATAQAFAQAIATAQGCNGVIYEAISCKLIWCIRLLLHHFHMLNIHMHMMYMNDS